MAKTPESSDHIVIVFKNQHNEKLFFKMKRDYPVKKVLVAYCKRRDVDYRSVRFLLNGSRFRPNLTPDELKMEDGDEIDAMLPMSGGSTCRNGDVVFYRVYQTTL